MPLPWFAISRGYARSGAVEPALALIARLGEPRYRALALAAVAEALTRRGEHAAALHVARSARAQAETIDLALRFARDHALAAVGGILADLGALPEVGTIAAEIGLARHRTSVLFALATAQAGSGTTLASATRERAVTLVRTMPQARSIRCGRGRISWMSALPMAIAEPRPRRWATPLPPWTASRFRGRGRKRSAARLGRFWR